MPESVKVLAQIPDIRYSARAESTNKTHTNELKAWNKWAVNNGVCDVPHTEPLVCTCSDAKIVNHFLLF